MNPFLLFLTLTLVYSSTGDLLDRVSSNAPIVRDLKDLYRTYSVNHTIDRQKDDINACQALNGGAGLNDSLYVYVDECEKLRKVRLSDAGVRKQVMDYLDGTIQNYRVLLKDGAHSTAFRNNYAEYEKLRKAYLKYVLKRFSLDTFVKLSGPDYWQRIDKKNYVNSVRFEEYQRLKSTNLPRAMEMLRSIIGETKNFQEWSIYEIEMADDYVLHADQFTTDTSDAFVTACRLYRRILDKKQYCLYLFEAWAKWRCTLQRTQGNLKSSPILNDEYEHMREETAAVILSFIAQHPKDEMAINEFIVLATHDMMLRFGEYKDGNQNTVEFKTLFGQAP